ncbi:hypothetical protein Tco_1549582 [Tanacetum coccineum]
MLVFGQYAHYFVAKFALDSAISFHVWMQECILCTKEVVSMGIFWEVSPNRFLSSILTGGWAYAFHQDKASSVKVPVANVTLFSSAHLLRENTDSVRSKPWEFPDKITNIAWMQTVLPEAAVKSQSVVANGIQSYGPGVCSDC